jgi:hypothetical protein
VATYFCLADGSVLHAIAGPVDANTFLYEARWIVNVHQRASLEGRDNAARYKQIVWQAHADRLARDHGLARSSINRLHEPTETGEGDNAADGGFTGKGALSMKKMDVLSRHRHQLANQGQVHLLAALFPLEKIEDVYRYVFEGILKEKISSLPVVEK